MTSAEGSRESGTGKSSGESGTAEQMHNTVHNSMHNSMHKRMRIRYGPDPGPQLGPQLGPETGHVDILDAGGDVAANEKSHEMPKESGAVLRFSKMQWRVLRAVAHSYRRKPWGDRVSGALRDAAEGVVKFCVALQEGGSVVCAFPIAEWPSIRSVIHGMRV